MSTLSAIFRLTDNYSNAIERITSRTTAATSGIDRASRSTDNLNSQFAASSNATSALTSKITTLIGTIATFATIKKAMDISDEYTNTNSRLALITSNLTQQRNLQEQIFEAADRSRGSYSAMADTVTKLGIVDGQYFSGTDQIVKFTETMQKMFKLSGTNSAAQSGAMLQIQQAIGMGRLQGQDLRVLSEDMPLAEVAIAKYLKVSSGAVKQMGTDGKITSQALINSILSYSGTVDKQIGGMSYTWGDYWNKITNGATKAFGSVFENETSALNSKGFQTFIDNIVKGFSVLAQAANKVLGAIGNISKFFSDNWGTIAPIIGGIVTAMLIYNGVLFASNILQGISTGLKAAAAIAAVAHGATLSAEALATTGMTQAQIAFNAALYACPLTWILLLIIALVAGYYIVIAIINKVAGTSISATGMIMGQLYGVKALFQNIGLFIADIALSMWGDFWAVINNIQVAFSNAWINIRTGWLEFVNVILIGIQSIIGWLNKIPGVSIDTSSIANQITANAQTAASMQSGKGTYQDPAAAMAKGFNTYKTFQSGWYDNAYKEGYKIGSNFEKSITDSFNNLGKLPGTPNNPTPVTGTGNGGAVTVNMADQDLQYLRDLAEKQFVNKFSSATLAPNIQVAFTGPISKDVDTDQLYKRIGTMLSEQIATAAEGV
jgi:tape measure domain-containing protein